MTKYEKLYGVKVDAFPNEEDNVKKKLKLATEKRATYYGWKRVQKLTFEEECELNEIEQAIAWAEKILEDISDDTN